MAKQKTKAKLYSAVEVTKLLPLHSTYRFVVMKKFKSEEDKDLFAWASVLIENRILSEIPPILNSLLSEQQVEDLTDLLKK